MRDDRERLRDILEAIERIDRYACRGRSAFDGDELIQNWVLHHLQIIGEACREVSRELRAAHTKVPWIQIAGMRNVLVHAYFAVNLDRVWVAVERDLPQLKEQISELIAQLPDSADQ